MKRRAALLAALLLPFTLWGQVPGNVIDLTQIYENLQNTLSSIDATERSMEVLGLTNEKIDSYVKLYKDFMGDDGTGSKIMSILKTSGMTQDLIESYNRLLKQTLNLRRMASSLQSSGADLWVVNRYLQEAIYLEQMGDRIRELVSQLLNETGLSKNEKIKMLQDAIAAMDAAADEAEDATEQMAAAAEGYEEGKKFGEQMSDMTSKNYEKEGTTVGDAQSIKIGNSLLRYISMIFGFLAIGCVLWAFVVYNRGGIAGDPQSTQVFYRLFIGLLAAAGFFLFLDKILS